MGAVNTKRQAFYKSRTWEKFVQGLRSERATAEGFVICEHCGKPIVKAYDCIGHHVEELTEENVDDALVALNPANVQLVHFRCHNEIHKRFGYAERLVQHVYIVYGAPFAGKRDWVNEVAEPGDIVCDINDLWTAVSTHSGKPNECKSVVFGLRDALLDMIKVRRGKWRNAYVVGGYPLRNERDRLADMLGADKLIHVNTPKEQCLLNAHTAEGKQWVLDWFDRFSG